MKQKKLFDLPEIIEGNKYDRISLLKEIPTIGAMTINELLQKLPLEILQAEIDRRKNIGKDCDFNSVENDLPKHLKLCIFKLDNGEYCIGKCKYHEHGDSELIEVYGKGLSCIVHRYRNWELHNFDKTKYFRVTLWKYV